MWVTYVPSLRTVYSLQQTGRVGKTSWEAVHTGCPEIDYLLRVDVSYISFCPVRASFLYSHVSHAGRVLPGYATANPRGLQT